MFQLFIPTEQKKQNQAPPRSQYVTHQLVEVQKTEMVTPAMPKSRLQNGSPQPVGNIMVSSTRCLC